MTALADRLLSTLDDNGDSLPELRLVPRANAPEPVVPEHLRPLMGRYSGPVIVAMHGTRDQPHDPVCTAYAIDCAETRDPSWWRERLSEHGRPFVRLVAFGDVDTMAGGSTIAVLEVGMMLPGTIERVVMPEAVAVNVPGKGLLYATTTSEKADGLDVVSIAQTTWRKTEPAPMARNVRERA